MTNIRGWRVLSILEIVIMAALIWWNDTLVASADGNDISILVFLLLVGGVIFQTMVFKSVRATGWRIFIILMIGLHLIFVPYLVFAIAFNM